jgi:nitrate reductase beta subunit
MADFHVMADGPGAPEHVAAGSGSTFQDDEGRLRFNLLGWNGRDPAPRLFGESS